MVFFCDFKIKYKVLCNSYSWSWKHNKLRSELNYLLDLRTFFAFVGLYVKDSKLNRCLIKTKLKIIKTFALWKECHQWEQTNKFCLQYHSRSQEPINRTAFLPVSAYPEQLQQHSRTVSLRLFFATTQLQLPQTGLMQPDKIPLDERTFHHFKSVRKLPFDVPPSVFCNIFMQSFCLQCFIRSHCLRSHSFSDSLS